VFCFRDSAEERGSEQCFVSGTVQEKKEVVSSVLFQGQCRRER
jgi:hypothetical protein